MEKKHGNIFYEKLVKNFDTKKTLPIIFC